MGERLRHRGPDDEGNLFDEKHGVFLGHRRLAIRDLTPAGRQPMFNEDRSVAVLVNGEIYNDVEIRSQLRAKGHCFVSTCDAEVVAHLFEEMRDGAWIRLRGMFAAIVYETRRGWLHLARDPLGIKPLYLLEHGDFVAFSSEIRAFEAIAGSDRGLDCEGVVDFLMLGSVPSPRTHRRGIRALRPGETILLSAEGLTRRGGPPVPAWCREAVESAPPSIETWRQCMQDSMKRHLVSDVPIGVFLSGGVDSGILTGLATEISNAEVSTISVTLPGHRLDESKFARETAARYGTRHTEVEWNQSDFETDLESFFLHLDLPSIDGLNTFVVSKAARQAGLTVSLSGVGGDELFAGYSTFRTVPRIARWHRVTSRLGMSGLISVLLKNWRRDSSGARVAEILRQTPAGLRMGYLGARGLFVGRDLEDLVSSEMLSFARAAKTRFLDETVWTVDSSLPEALVVGGLELTRYMSSQLLRDTDAMSMAHSLEVRTPLVDVEVVRRALPFLVHPIVGDGYPKWTLRQALDKPLPESVVRRSKQGFVFPWQEWLRGAVLADFDARLEHSAEWRHILNPVAVRRWRDAYRRGWAHWSCLWAIYVLMRMMDRPKG